MKDAQLRASLDLVMIKRGLMFPRAVLQLLMPTIEVTLFVAKLYKLDASEVGHLLRQVHNSDVVQALTAEGGEHSTELQDYVLELGYEYLIESGAITFSNTPPQGEVLPELWKAAEVEIAASIQEVADKLKDVVGAMPGKQGEMVFKSLMMVNAKRPILGDYKAHIHHAPQRENLVVLDVSGSMTEGTIERIIEDVVALSFMANAHLAIVSNTTTHWQPGEYDTANVLAVAEYGGTHYETLAPLFDMDWGVVVCIADYDSSPAAKSALAQCRGSIEQVFDISLVSQPTYLAEVVGQLAEDVKPLMVAAHDLTGSRW